MINPDPTRAYFNVLRGTPRIFPPSRDPDLLGTHFPPAAALLVQPSSGGGFLLIRIPQDGSMGGDSWNEDWDDVREEIAAEFADVMGEWREVPEGTADPAAYVRSRM